MGGRKGHLEHFRWKTVAGGRQRKTPATLLRGFRARWEAGSDTWNAFAEIPWQVDGGEETPGTLLQRYRGRWTAEKRHLERFCRDTVAGGRRRRDTWNAFTGIPCQVGSEKCYLEHFHGNSVPGGRQEDVTWNALNAFAGKPCQVDGGKRHLERFRGDSVPGGRQEVLPDTLLREYRGRWTANLSDTGRDSAMKMKIMENLLLFVVNSYFRRAKKWKHANHG